MKRRKFRYAIAALAGAAFVVLAGTGAVRAQSSSAGAAPMLTLYVDPATGQVFTRPGKGRSLLTTIPATALDPNAIERHVEEKTQAQMRQNQQQLSDLGKRTTNSRRKIINWRSRSPRSSLHGAIILPSSRTSSRSAP